MDASYTLRASTLRYWYYWCGSADVRPKKSSTSQYTARKRFIHDLERTGSSPIQHHNHLTQLNPTPPFSNPHNIHPCPFPKLVRNRDPLLPLRL